jgi:phosphoadenosine phosphosulfate reductase
MKVLQFSGGADSLATLFVKRPEWSELTVLWCDTGAAYPDTRSLVDKVFALVPNFREVKSDKPKWEAQNGLAVDVVPERATLLGSIIHSPPPAQLYTSHLRCCSANIWAPLDTASRELGATVIIRGQREQEANKAPIKSGHRDPSGILYEFPIEGWSRDDVYGYCLKVCPDLFPAYYLNGEVSGHDCWDCIAYLKENVQRIRNLPDHNRVVVMERLLAYNATIRRELAPLEELLS